MMTGDGSLTYRHSCLYVKEPSPVIIFEGTVQFHPYPKTMESFAKSAQDDTLMGEQFNKT